MRELTKEDLKEVTEVLKDRHPLYYSSVGMADIFPFLGWMPCFTRRKDLENFADQNNELYRRGDDSDLEFDEHRRKKKVDAHLKIEENKEFNTGTDQLLHPDKIRSDSFSSRSSRGRRGRERAKNIVDTHYKDFSVYGFGAYSYFYLMERLMILFLILSVLASINMFLFGYFGDNDFSDSFLDYVGLGHLGFSSTYCRDIPFHVGELTLNCPAGTIQEVVSFGITPTDATILDACLPNDHTIKCEKVYDEKAVKESIMSNCIGKQSCVINARSFVNPKSVPVECTGDLAQFYTQVSCKFDEKDLHRRDIINKILIGESVLIILILLAYFYITQSSLEKKYKEWDKKTTTIADYSLKLELPQKLYDDFILNDYKDSSENPIFAFKSYLRNNLSRFINKRNGVPEEELSNAKIIDIEFTFSNILLIELMHERAEAIESHDNEKRHHIEKEIIEQYSKDHFIPKEAYIIFETEDAFEKAHCLGTKKHCCYTSPAERINDVGIYVESADQPSNTEWENCHKSNWETFLRILAAVVILGIVISIGFALLYITEFNKEIMHEKYPEVNCEIVKRDAGDKETMKQYAFMEWYNIYTHGMKRENILEISTSNMQCFCEDLDEELGWSGAANEIFEIHVNGKSVRGKVCKDFQLANLAIELGYFVIPLIIEIINMFMKIFINISARLMKLENKTSEECIVFLLEFLLTFFDSTVLILLINANFEGTGIPITFFEGNYCDFTAEWYSHIAPIFLLSMFLKMAIPMIKFISLYSVKKLLILFDKRGSCWQAIKGKSNDEIVVKKSSNTNVFTSKKHNMDYADLHSGSKFKISSPFAKVMCMIFMCLMFGIGQPIMFPCTLIFIVIMYIFNKILIVYWFIKPPKYDDNLSQMFVSCIKYGTLLFCGFSYWILTNRQMFGNHILPIRFQQDLDKMDHSIYNLELNQSMILFVGFFVLIGYMIFYDAIHDAFGIFSEHSISIYNKEREDLHNFYSSLSNKNLIDLIEEEKLVREKYGKKKLFDSTYNALNKEHEERMNGKEIVNDKILYGLPSYQFTFQSEYCEEIGYQPVSKRAVGHFDSKKIDMIDNSKRVFDYPFFGDYNSIKDNLFYEQKEDKRHFEGI